MAKKPEISARQTIVLDDKALEELDDLSLTGMMREMSETIGRLLEEQQASDQGPEHDELEGWQPDETQALQPDETQSERPDDAPIPDLHPVDATDDIVEDRDIAALFDELDDGDDDGD